MHVIQLLGSLTGLAFVAGINLYATVLTVGLGVRYGLIHLPTELSALSVLAHPYVLITAAIIYLVEFFADKIPWVDSFWDSFHTLIRPVGAAILGVTAIGNVDPALEVAVFLLCGGVALSTHSTKSGIRLMANHSPEPMTNIGLSVIEDVLAVFGSWLAIYHPAFMLGLVLSFFIIFLLVAPTLFRLLRVEIIALRALMHSFFTSRETGNVLFDKVPQRYAAYLPDEYSSRDTSFFIRCVAGKEMETNKNSIGFLCLMDNSLVFLTRKHFRMRRVTITMSDIEEFSLEKKLLFDRLIFRRSGKRSSIYLFKDGRNRSEKILEILKAIQQKGQQHQEAPAP
jgi:hypothetical protein